MTSGISSTDLDTLFDCYRRYISLNTLFKCNFSMQQGLTPKGCKFLPYEGSNEWKKQLFFLYYF